MTRLIFHKVIHRVSSLRTDQVHSDLLILKVAIARPLRRLFDYLPPEHLRLTDLKPGIRILVPLGRTRCVGYVLEVCHASEMDVSHLKHAIEVIDDRTALNPSDWHLINWAARYYHQPLGEALASGFPPLRAQPDENRVPTALRLIACLDENTPGDVRGGRQRWLLEAVRASTNGLSESELSSLSWDWRRAAKALSRKGLITIERRAVESVLADASRVVDFPKSLNPDQKKAVEAVISERTDHGIFLLEGVTGSGKTEVYLSVIEEFLKRGQQALVLLPEISLTPQLESRFRARFSVPIVVFHSGLSNQTRRNAWLAMAEHKASILLGTRSAVFTPMALPGVIVVDEEHDLSFKQQEGFRYSARDMAVFRAKQLGITVLLGSATPSFESLANVERRRYRRLRLPQRAAGARQPDFAIVNVRGKTLSAGLSPALIDAIRSTLERGEQVILFLNRRGFAPSLICHACGWVAQCKACDTHLVLHAKDRTLTCHHCGFERHQPKACPSCQSDDLRPLGLGTERVEGRLSELFPKARTARIDRDSTRRKGSLESVLTSARNGELDILVGTQLLAKGHDFPGVTLVGMIDVDAGLFCPDFRGGERLAQQVIQVAGRAGRAELPGTVLLQTRHPEHPLLLQLIKEGYGSFAKSALQERKSAGLPPYTFQALIRAESKNREDGRHFLQTLRNGLENDRKLWILGPVSAPLAKRSGRYRYQLLLQSASRRALHGGIDTLVAAAELVSDSRKVRWSVDVDPQDFM